MGAPQMGAPAMGDVSFTPNPEPYVCMPILRLQRLAPLLGFPDTTAGTNAGRSDVEVSVDPFGGAGGGGMAGGGGFGGFGF